MDDLQRHRSALLWLHVVARLHVAAFGLLAMLGLTVVALSEPPDRRASDPWAGFGYEIGLLAVLWCGPLAVVFLACTVAVGHARRTDRSMPASGAAAVIAGLHVLLLARLVLGGAVLDPFVLLNLLPWVTPSVISLLVCCRALTVPPSRCTTVLDT